MGYAHGNRWTIDKIQEALLFMIESEDMDRMPTRSEVEQFYGNHCLTNAISKRIGWYELADMLNLPIKMSETTFGKEQELAVLEDLASMGHYVCRMPQNFPYDLLVDGSVKIDVNASRLYKGDNGSFYSFNLEKPFCTCDIYILRLLSPLDGSVTSLIVPSKDVPQNTQISVGAKASKYYRYKNKWDYVDQYSDFFKSIQ